MMNKERLSAFSDAMVGIFATIIVLELKVPEPLTWHTLASQWHMYFAFITSFILLYGTWYNHHGMFERAKVINVQVYWANGLWLLSLSFIPYVTEMVGEHPNEFLAEFLYLTMNFVRLLAFQFLGSVTTSANPDMFRNASAFSRRYMWFSATLRFGSLILAMIIAYWWPLIGIIWTFIMVVTYIIIAVLQERQILDQLSQIENNSDGI